jgi:putative membrane protein
LLIALFVRADYAAMLQVAGLAGWNLLWLVPFRGLYFALYALGWHRLLQPYDPERSAGLGYVFWVTTVREAIDRLLPVASIGGGIVAIRLMRWRGLPALGVSASVIVEILLTLVALYLFSALGLILLTGFGTSDPQYHHLLLGLLLSLPIPVVTALLLRYGSVFQALESFLRPVVGVSAMSEGAVALDQELRVCLRRGGTLFYAGSLQLVAVITSSLEIWFVLRLFQHPVSFGAAIILESMTQAMRHLAFFVPAGLGVQEAGLVLFGHALGIGSELALAVSLAKRIREILCGLPPLLSWQYLEVRRLRTSIPKVS